VQRDNLNTPTAAPSPNARPRKTLGLTGITINAMALMAPGAFMWLLYQSQAAGSVNGVAEIWPGVLLALVLALLTAGALGELARRYPKAGLRSAYHYAESAFRENGAANRSRWYRPAKFVTGWAAHLYYWTFPGIMVAFTGVLADYLLVQFGYHPTVFGKLILTVSFSALVGFLALRGITGSTTSSIVLNIIQLSALIFFSVLAFLFRGVNPIGLPAGDWLNPTVSEVVFPKSLENVVFQAAIAIFLMVGFEASTALGGAAENAPRDVPRAAVLALVIQGAFAYLLEYFAAGLAMNSQIAVMGSRLPIGDLALQMGNALLNGNGSTILLTIAFTIFIALLASALTALNNGVRISFSMSLDSEMPSVLSFLHPQYSTPYVTVILLGGVSAVIGSIGMLGGTPVLMGLILASNLGAFILYALLALLTIGTYRGKAENNRLKHLVLPAVGLVANLGIAIAFPLIGFTQGGMAAQASMIALAVGLLWILISAANYFSHR
jgi:basic amino acid/polyamine antiporter, APA family